jgi:TolA-binding protein
LDFGGGLGNEFGASAYRTSGRGAVCRRGEPGDCPEASQPGAKDRHPRAAGRRRPGFVPSARAAARLDRATASAVDQRRRSERPPGDPASERSVPAPVGHEFEDQALESRPIAQDLTRTPSEAASTAPPGRESAASSPPAAPAATTAETGTSDPGEDSYSEGFRLWRDGRYDQAITSLRAFLSGFPTHRRASFARNLIGRALLDKGEPRPAAEALLANYRADPKGERAPDSLYYLGQALLALKQPAQACKAYAELEDVYGASIRPDLRALVTQGKAEARC